MKAHRVLLVDDEASLRITLAANLELEGFEVVEASSGEDALALATTQRFDLVFTDIKMRGITGVELFRRLRAQGLDVPVVLMTAFAVEGLIDAALSEGAYTLVPKPFDVEQVIRTLKRASARPAVLVIDPDAPAQTSTAHALHQMGVRARAATSANEAVAAVHGGDVDVCVVDLGMPGGAGPELVAQLRGEAPDLVIIAMSGSDVPEMNRLVSAEGVHGFLRKPFAVPELVRSIALGRAPKVRR